MNNQIGGKTTKKTTGSTTPKTKKTAGSTTPKKTSTKSKKKGGEPNYGDNNLILDQFNLPINNWINKTDKLTQAVILNIIDNPNQNSFIKGNLLIFRSKDTPYKYNSVEIQGISIQSGDYIKFECINNIVITLKVKEKLVYDSSTNTNTNIRRIDLSIKNVINGNEFNGLINDFISGNNPQGELDIDLFYAY